MLAAVLLSALARRSVMSLRLLFLVAGAVMGNGGFGLIAVGHDGDLVRHVAEIALFVVPSSTVCERSPSNRATPGARRCARC